MFTLSSSSGGSKTYVCMYMIIMMLVGSSRAMIKE